MASAQGPPAEIDAETVPTLLAPIASQVRAGETQRALEALRALPASARNVREMRYLEGRLAERAGELDAAIDALALATSPLAPGLVWDAARRRARLLARCGRCDEALDIIDSLDPREVDARSRALRAECMLARGSFAQAESLLRDAMREDARDVDSFAIGLMLAEAQLRAGARERAITTLREIAVARPEHPDAERSLELLRELTGRPVAFTFDERLARAERFSASRDHERAIAELETLERPRDRTRAARLVHARGMALFRSRHAYREAATVLGQAASLGGPTATADAFHSARALSRAGRDADAIRAYRRLVRRAPTSREGAEAEYLAAWLELRLGRAAGRRAMERFLRGPRAERAPQLAREAEWHLAFDAFRRRSFGRAAGLFEAYARRDSSPLIRGRGTYWRGRALEEARNSRGAIAAYREAIAASPLHWYALLARQRLVRLGEDPGAPLVGESAPDTQPDADGSRGIELPPEITTLIALGLDADARAEVRARERELRRQLDLQAMVHLYEELSDHERAYRLSAERDELSRPALGADAWAWRAAYPRAFEAAVLEAARAQSIDPELLWAIMRQESGYDPGAVSYADAIGLLQMLPSTGAAIARGIGVPFEREMLFEPTWNTRLAAAYVRRLCDRLGVPLCFAAFNAGETRVLEWLARHGDTDLDAFVEEIPFEQTRNYIRRVTSHLARYMYLRDPNAGWPALDLPARVGPSSIRAPAR